MTSSFKKYLPWGKRAVSVIVLVAVCSAAIKAFRQLDQQELDWTEIVVGYLVLACLTYFLTMCTGWAFWHIVMVRMRQTPAWFRSFQAFFYSQLAKYIPGKAMVVVVRTSVVAGKNVRSSVAAVSVFVETLTWVSIASTIAFAMFVFDRSAEPSWQITAGVLFVLTGVATFPPLFRRLLELFAAKRFRPALDDIRRGVNFKTTLIGWSVMSCGWCCGATSLWLVLMALPGPDPTLADWPLCLAVATLATVIGFASFLPGGVGVRELVMIPLLGVHFGSNKALAAAITLRALWILTEFLIGCVVYSIDHWKKRERRHSSENANSRNAA